MAVQEIRQYIEIWYFHETKSMGFFHYLACDMHSYT